MAEPSCHAAREPDKLFTSVGTEELYLLCSVFVNGKRENYQSLLGFLEIIHDKPKSKKSGVFSPLRGLPSGSARIIASLRFRERLRNVAHHL
ncbi:TPA: hypothetical protein DDW35_06565, partial [Candidatus Sumerlaeota bacterium]|nr:hypothetical protein [Candidatus Sumerlaeota bacterium]